MGLEVTRPSRWRSWAVTVLLWLLVGVAAVGGLAGLLRPAPTRAVEPAAVAEPELNVGAVGMAEWAVRAAIGAGSRDAAGRVVAVPADRTIGATDADEVVVLSASTIDGRLVDESYWAVTVAADVQLGDAPTMSWFFEVGVAVTADGPVVVSDPALVPPPPAAQGRVELAGTLRAPDLADPVVETTASFLAALLSGDPAVGRWTAPGVELAPAVVSGIFDRITVERAAVTRIDDHARRVLVTVTARTATDASLRLVYEVTVAAREGRWEITSLSGAPALASVDTDTLARETTVDPAPASTTTTTTSTPSAATGPAATSSSSSSEPEIAPGSGTNPNPYEELEEES